MNQYTQAPLSILQFTVPDVLFDNRIITIDFRLESPINGGRASTLWLSSPTDTEAFFVADNGDFETPIRQLCQQVNNRRVRIECPHGGVFLHISDQNGTATIGLGHPPPNRQIERLKMMLSLEKNKNSDSMRQVYDLQAEITESIQKREQLEQRCEEHLREINFLRDLLREHSSIHEHEHNISNPLTCSIPTISPHDKVPLMSMESLISQPDTLTIDNGMMFQISQQEKRTLVTLSHSMNSPTRNDPTSSRTTEKTPKELLIGIAQQIMCSLCPESVQLPDLKQMEQHFLQTHVDQEKKSCRACPTEQMPRNITQHIRQHANKIYSCTRCGKRGQKHLIRAHLRTHTGEKPFSCETCGRGFADASTLRRHRLIHTGEKKHECPICGRSIARKDNAKVHMQSHKI